jgi:hypothetical protein
MLRSLSAEAVWKLDLEERGMADFSGLAVLTGQMYSDQPAQLGIAAIRLRMPTSATIRLML